VTSDIIRSFNRDTVWVATGLLGTVVFAALALAFQDRQTNATQAERDLLSKVNSATVGSVVPKSASSNDKVTPGSESSVDHAPTETPLKEIPSSQMEPVATTPPHDLAFTPEINRNAHRQDSARVRVPKTRMVRNRSSVWFGSVDVKRRLIELWHQSLAKTEKSRNWTAFSKLNTGVNKKAAYTAETTH
jgi:hypothetical protein